MRNKKRLCRNIFKWGSLFMTLLFTAVACGYSFINSDQTVEDVEHLVPEDVKDKDKVIPLKELKIDFNKNFETYYVDEEIQFTPTLVPSNATHKNIKVDIPQTSDGNPAFAVDMVRRIITIFEPGDYSLKFYVESENPICEKNLSVVNYVPSIFEIEDENNNVITNKDIFIDKINDTKETIININVDEECLNRLPYNIKTSNSSIVEIEAITRTQYKLIPKKSGTATITFEFKNLKRVVYVTVDKTISDVDVTLLDYIFGTNSFNNLYLAIPQYENMDIKRFRVEFEHPKLFKRIKIEKVASCDGIGIQLLSNNNYVSKITEDFYENFKVFYDYPGGTTIEFNQGNLKLHILPGQTLTKYSFFNLPTSENPVEFGTLVNAKNECYQDEFNYKFDIKNKTKTNLESTKFEVISGNASDLNLSKSTYDQLNIKVNSGVNPSNYIVRYIFDTNKYDVAKPETYYDFPVNFKNYTSLPLDNGVIYDFKYIYGELDKDTNGVIPQNYVLRSQLTNQYFNYTDSYEIKDKNGEIIPAFKDGGIVIEPVNDDANNYKINVSKKKDNPNIIKDFTLSHIESRSPMEVKVTDHPIFRVTSPVFKFFGVEPIWTTIDFILDENPEYINFNVSKGGTKLFENKIHKNETYDLSINNEDDIKFDNDVPWLAYKAYNPAHSKNSSTRTEPGSGNYTNLVSTVNISNNDPIYYLNDEFYAVAPGSTKVNIGYCKDWLTNEPKFNITLNVTVNGKEPICDTNEFNFEKIDIDTKYDYSANDFDNNIVRINRDFKLHVEGISDSDLLDDYSFDVIKGNITNKPGTLVFSPYNPGLATILIQHKTYKVIQKTIDVFVRNSTSDFEIAKSQFENIKYNSKNNEYVIDGFDKRDYQLKFTPFVESSSKYYELVPVENCDNVINLKDGNIIRTLKQGTAKFKVIYGDKNSDEVTYIKNVTIKVKDAQAYHLNISYKTRKLIGHFGLFACLGFSTMCFLTMWLFDRKYWNILTIPGSMAYSYLIAYISEFIQGFIPSRCFAMSDVLLNFEGSLMGIGILLLGYLTYVLIKVILRQIKKKKITK